MTVNFSHAKSMDVALTSLIVDVPFNSRSNIDGNSGDSTSVQNVADSLHTSGQITPILVERRTVKEGGKNVEKYYLVSGFRRVAAATKLAKENPGQWETLAARVFEPMTESQRRYLNLIENTAREDLTSYDLAMACVPIHRTGESSTDIAGKLGKSDSYIRSLLGILLGTSENKNHATPAVLRRWQLECGPQGKGLVTVCSTDWLAKTCKLDAEAQDKELMARVGTKAKKGDPDYKERSPSDPVDPNDPKPSVLPKGPNKTIIGNAKLVLTEKVKTEKDAKRRDAMMVAIDTLRWVLGNDDKVGEILSKDEAQNYGKTA